MDPRLIDYYHRELQHVREMGAEFSREFPKIASRLTINGTDCADPYVERLFEGFAFLAARVQLKIDSEFPRFTESLLEAVHPNYLAPVPSMAVVQLQPDLAEADLAEGFEVPRGSVLRSVSGRGESGVCEFRTGHPVTLWPVELAEAEYLTDAAGLHPGRPALPRRAEAAIRLRLRATAGLSFKDIALDTLTLFLHGGDEAPMHVLESLIAGALSVIVRPVGAQAEPHHVVTPPRIGMRGFEAEEALLPTDPRTLDAYRLLQEYFAMPQRFMFVDLCSLGSAVRQCPGNEIDVIILLDRADLYLEKSLDVSLFKLFCTPAVNLFPKRTDRIHLDSREHEYHVVPERTRAMDFEIYAVTGVEGIGSGMDAAQRFHPLFGADYTSFDDPGRAFYTVHREQRVPSARQRQRASRAAYGGSETYVSLVDMDEAPYRTDLRQLAVDTLCTNRDLPLTIVVGQGKTDFTLESGGPVASVRCVAGPTAPRPSRAQGNVNWQLISHLIPNYLHLQDGPDGSGASALRELLALYADLGQTHVRKQIDGIISVETTPVTRRIRGQGPLTFGRGIEVTVTLDETAFGGIGIFLLGAVLDRFFSSYVSVNSFTETVIRAAERGEIIRWKAKTGTRRII